MFKSLRWRLQLWHTLVLLVVLSSFGAIVHRLDWQTRLQQVDAELNRTAGDVMYQMRRLIPRRPSRPEVARPEGDSAPGTPADQNSATPNATARPDAPPGEVDPDRSNVAPNTTRERFRRDPGPLPAEFEQLFIGDEDSRFYFTIWGNDGQLLQKSESAPVLDYPDLKIGPDELPPIQRVRERRGDHVYREVIRAGSNNRSLTLLVGRSLEKDLIAHHQSGLLLAVTGLVILAAGALGGGWLSARAIRPISDMTAAAEAISAQNLSERINVKETDSEFGKLALVLNGTFDRLQSAFERQQQFTADASHELRTPLSVISAHTELALSRPRSNDDYRAAIETCQRASLKMRSLIDALLVLARFDSGAPSLKQDQVDIEPLIQDCVELVRSLATARGIQIECQTSSCDVLGDWDRLSQVVTNLLTNAIRYNVDEGQIRITNRIEDGCAVVSVADTGIGIAADQLPRIFDRFYQVDKARSRAEGSCGLGLSICKTIVEAHGGTITATSQPDVGTTIEVRLRLSAGTMPAEKSASDEEQLVSAMPEHLV